MAKKEGCCVELDIYDVQGMFPKADYLRGMQYYHQNRMKGLRWVKDQGQPQVSCYVQGSQSYQVSFWEVAPGRLDGRCSCPRFADAGYCKHLVAAMIVFVFDPPTDTPPVSDRYAQALLRSYLSKSDPSVEAASGDFRLFPQLENNYYSELWNLFDFLMPGYLYAHTAFREKLEKPIIKSKDTQASAQLRKLVQPVLLRRLKHDVLKELPPKIDHVRRIALSQGERKVYQASVQALRSSLGDDHGKLQILAALT